MKLTELEIIIEKHLTIIPRFERLPEEVVQSMSDVPIERRQQLLRTLAYMAMKCDAWERYWKELYKQIESDPLIKRVK